MDSFNLIFNVERFKAQDLIFFHRKKGVTREGKQEKIHQGFEDPAALKGSEDEK